jgi:hypothetical protein
VSEYDEHLDTLGQIAYDVAHEHLGITANTPPWNEAHGRVREAWRAAADAVLMHAHPTGRTTVAHPATLDTAPSTPGSRRIEPPFMVRAGDVIGQGAHAFRVWRGGDLVADYAAGDDGVLRPVTT